MLTYSYVDRPFEGGTAVTGELAGSIDANTLPEFRDSIREFLDKGRKFVLLDASKLKYVNSSGLGALIKLATEFQQEGGQFAMYAIPDKIRALFKMLGILDVVKVYETDAEAFKAFSGGVAPAPVKREFPLLIRCISCRRKIELPEPGYYRCPRCGSCFSVKPEGRVKGYQIDQPQSIEIRVACVPDFSPAVHEAAAALARLKEYGDSVSRTIDKVLEKACTELWKGSTGSDACSVYMVADRKEFRAAFKVDRPVFEPSGPLRDVRQLVDEMEVISLPGGGQVLKFLKKVDSLN